MSDIDKIMKRNEMQRAAKELAQKEFVLPGDSTGGISKLYAASIKHNSVDDN